MSEQLVDAETILARMRAGTREIYEIRLRGQIIPFRLLTLDERLEIRNRAILATKSINGDDVYLAAILQKQTLMQAASISSQQPGFMNERLMSLLRLDEVQYLYEEYDKICQDANPSLEIMDPEKFRLLVDAIKKKLDCFADRIVADAIKKSVLPLSTIDPRTGRSSLTAGQFTWWVIMQVVESEERAAELDDLRKSRAR